MDYEKKYKRLHNFISDLYPFMSEYCKEKVEGFLPELKEPEDEKIRKGLIDFVNQYGDNFYGQISKASVIAWLEKQGEQPSAIRWHDVSLIPQEMEELLVEWDSEDATWHEIAFYHADTKTFWNGTRQVENVTRWCYIIDLLEKQGWKKPFDYENANIQQKDFAPQEDAPRYSIGDVLCDKSCTTLDKDAQPNYEIVDIRNGLYICDKGYIPISQQDEYELVAKKIEQKSAWSEEDEHRVKDTIYFLDTAKKHYASTVELDACINWLNSLKQRIGGKQ